MWRHNPFLLGIPTMGKNHCGRKTNHCLLGVPIVGRNQCGHKNSALSQFRDSGDFNEASLLAFQWKKYFNSAASPLPSRGPAL